MAIFTVQLHAGGIPSVTKVVEANEYGVGEVFTWFGAGGTTVCAIETNAILWIDRAEPPKQQSIEIDGIVYNADTIRRALLTADPRVS